MPNIEKVLLVTERPLLIARHRQLLEYAGLEVDFAVITPDVMEQNIRPGACMLVLVDVESPYSLETLARSVESSPLSRFVLSASCVTPGLIQRALSSGMHGVLSMLIPVEEAALALGRICRGECHYRFNEMPERPPKPMQFSDREQTIVSMIGKGYRNRDIASAINRSESNVKMALNRLLRKTGARSRGELAALGETLRSRPAVEPAGSLQPIAGHSFDAIWMFAGQTGQQ